jgi:hypothetical protein
MTSRAPNVHEWFWISCPLATVTDQYSWLWMKADWREKAHVIRHFSEPTLRLLASPGLSTVRTQHTEHSLQIEVGIASSSL